jgi:hypothetical protein
MSLTKVSYSMIQGSVKSVSDYGAVGDGVADDTAALQAMMNDCSNKVIVFPAGTYKITSVLTVGTIINSQWIGDGQVTITGSFGYSMVQFVSTTNFTIQNIKFENTYVNATLTGGDATVYWAETVAIDCNIDNVTIDNCTFTNPSCQSQALVFFFRITQNPVAYKTGVMRNLTVSNNRFENVGQTAMTLMNRQTSTDRYTSCSNVRVLNNYAKNLGNVSGASFGFFISLDGFGQDFEVSGNSIYGHVGNAIENVGWINGLINGNIVGAGKNATTHRMISLDGNQTFSGPGGGSTAAPVSGVVVSNNIAMVDQTFYDQFANVSNSCFSNNIHRTAAALQFGALSIIKSTFNITNGSQFISNNRAAISLGDATGTVTKNIFTNCIFDNSSSASSTATVYCTGAGTTFNTLTGVLDSAGTGTTFTQADSAANNVFTSLV